MMKLLISDRARIPMYEQIAQQLKLQIYQGILLDGDILPSVRSLAQELNVSVITVRRAYTDLENDGFIESVPAKGSFVSDRYIERLKQLGNENMIQHLVAAVRLSYVLDIPKDTLISLLTNAYDTNQRSENEDILSYLGINEFLIKRG